MFCDVKNCNNLAEYLRIIEIDKSRRIKFNVCIEHNKENWKMLKSLSPMACKNCGRDNAPLKKCCEFCGAFLEGRTINNVTGKPGYRNADGSFTLDKPISKEETP